MTALVGLHETEEVSSQSVYVHMKCLLMIISLFFLYRASEIVSRPERQIEENNVNLLLVTEGILSNGLKKVML